MPKQLVITAIFPKESLVRMAKLQLRTKKKKMNDDPQNLSGHKPVDMKAMGEGKFTHTLESIPDVGKDHRLLIRVFGSDLTGSTHVILDAPAHKHPKKDKK